MSRLRFIYNMIFDARGAPTTPSARPEPQRLLTVSLGETFSVPLLDLPAEA
jgi:hypothetical protein